MKRNGATYCAAANGKALQTPAAEGAKFATFNLVRACKDKSLGSILYGVRPLAFIHDEILSEFEEDDRMYERATEKARIMVDSMKIVCPDVPIKAEPCFMYRWNKAAEPVFDDAGNLTVWSEAS